MARNNIYSLDDQLDFGVYKGSELYQVLTTDPRHIESLIENQEIELDNEAYEMFQNCLENHNIEHHHAEY